MKTKQELLDFYGVEVGKKYQITSTDLKIAETNIFTVVETSINYGGLALRFLDNSGFPIALTLLSECDYEEVKQPILDDKEREYLQRYVMNNPAFKGKVAYIRKGCSTGYEYLRIILKNDGVGYLPRFKEKSMYKNMNAFIDYTPQELGLEE